MADQWERFQKYLYRDESLGVSVDISRMRFQESFFQTMEKPMLAALAAMSDLESGKIANLDEQRQVGHYWLRAPEMAPSPEQRRQIEETFQSIRQFAEDVHQGRIAPGGGGRFRNLLLIGIGGSALGPQFIADALGFTEQPLRPYFLDNTDPDGIDRVFSEIGDEIGQTLTVVTSKSGRTKETRNGMLEAQAFYERAGLEFGPNAVAITDEPSDLDTIAVEKRWLRRFPMWDWVGGRTSVFSAVGMLPAALLGFDIGAFREGARLMDETTRNGDPRQNPAALLALMWYLAGNGRGDKDMVVLPYKDRLALFPRYLQQLVMESLGKELDLQGRVVNQGLVVYGNKGSTDQHAYVQQLRGGANNFFVTFIEVLYDRSHPSVDVDPGVTSGDYLNGFLQGTRQALFDKDRESLTISLERVDAASVGKLIALFDRAVGLYASLIGINAYNQPGVEAGKIAAERVIRIQGKVLDVLRAAEGPLTAPEAAAAAEEAGDVETVFHVLRHLSANPGRGVKRTTGASAAEDRFEAIR